MYYPDRRWTGERNARTARARTSAATRSSPTSATPTITRLNSAPATPAAALNSPPPTPTGNRWISPRISAKRSIPSIPRSATPSPSFDVKHNFVVSYDYQLPFDQFFHPNRLTQGWSLSGITRFASGFPVTMINNGDNSLIGTNPNGVNNSSIDEPDYNGGPLHLNRDPRTNGNQLLQHQLLQHERAGRRRARRSAGSSMVPARRTTTWQSPKTCRSPNRSRCSSASRPSTSSTTPSSTAPVGRRRHRQLDLRPRDQRRASAHPSRRSQVLVLKKSCEQGMPWR